MRMPTSLEMEDALVSLIASGATQGGANPQGMAKSIVQQASASTLVTAFVDHHMNHAPSAFADGVLIGLQIAELRSRKP